MIALQVLLGGCLAASVVYHLLTIACAHRWRRQAPPAQTPPLLPPVTVLKPLRDTDPQQRASFSTFCLQDYPTYQIVFGALDADDPGLATARAVQADHPAVDIAIVEGTDSGWLNRKVSNLAAMLPQAKHDLLMLCDSDMRVDEDYLRRIASQFADPEVGLVTCPYRGFAPQSLASRLEALGIGADFIPSVFVAYYLWGVRPAFGSTIALTRQTLEGIGGFARVADELADDYKLAEAVGQLGKRVVLSDYVVDDVLGAESFGAMWSRRLRWAKTSRMMRPGPYSGAFITFTLPLGVAFAIACHLTPAALAASAAAYAIRCASAAWVGIGCTRDTNAARLLPLLPVSDLVSFALWVGSFFGSTILWRGERFRVGHGGRLIRSTARESASQTSPSTKRP
jgi:ceramide glucosyltransferase